jgi:hypothetical protein
MNKINIYNVITNITLLTSIIVYLKNKNMNKYLKMILAFIGILFLGVKGILLNNIYNKIFTLNFISINAYLLLLLIGNIIIILTASKNTKKSTKILNQTLYLINSIILLINLIIATGIRENFFITKTMVIARLIDINLIAFIAYINILNIKYIITKTIISNYNLKYKHIINGIDCSIIFEDKNEKNKTKNYRILKRDINAKLTNGYTLEETKTLKNIMNKLEINNTNDLNLNMNKLNKITEEEYNLLKEFSKRYI